MARPLGTNIGAQIVPFDNRDPYHTHEDSYGKGGLAIFTNFSILTSQVLADSAPPTTLTFNRRKIGQVIYIQDIGRYYKVISTTERLSSGNTLQGTFPLEFSRGIFSTNIVPSLSNINVSTLSGVEYSTVLGPNLTADESFTLFVHNLKATDHIQAKTKSFSVKHPTKPNKKLNYGSLESPYHGIRLTGIGTIKNGSCIVELPEYISKFVHRQGVNIQLTNYGHGKLLYVDQVDMPKNRFLVRLDGFLNKFFEYDFFWTFTAVRRDVPNLIVEV